MDLRAAIENYHSALIQLADESDSDSIRNDIAQLQGTVSQLVAKLASRSSAFRKQRRRQNAQPPKHAPIKGPQQQKRTPSSTDTPQRQKDSQGHSKELSSIQQGIRKAAPSIVDQQQALRGKVFGAQNDDVVFRKAAKAIAS